MLRHTDPERNSFDPRFAAAIRVDRLTKRYGSLEAVDQVSFSVRSGTVHGLIGPNGAGKTTTLECLLGLRRPDNGTIAVNGQDPRGDAITMFRTTGAFLQEDAGLYRRVRTSEAIRLYADIHGVTVDVGAVAATWGLQEKLKSAYGELSGGQKARLHLALATIGRPEVLILDEPTAGLDPVGRREIWEIIRHAAAREGLTVLVSTHHLDEAERFCNRVTMLHHGAVILDGEPERLLDRYGFRTYIECVDANLPPEALRHARWCSERRDGTSLVLSDDRDAEVVRAVGIEAGLASRLVIRPATLDDLFLAIADGMAVDGSRKP